MTSPGKSFRAANSLRILPLFAIASLNLFAESQSAEASQFQSISQSPTASPPLRFEVASIHPHRSRVLPIYGPDQLLRILGARSR